MQIKVQLEEIEHHLKKNLMYRDICQKILYQKIINRASADRNLCVTEEEIEAEAIRHRRENRLEKAADTYAWLADQMIDPDDWESGIRERLLRQKLVESLFAQDIEKFFNQNRLNFDQVVLYQIIVPYEKLAWEIFYQIEEEEMSFYQAAHLYDIDDKRRSYCGHEGKLYRWRIQPEMAARIFAAKPQEVLTPIKTEQGYHLLLVEEFIPAQLTPEIREEILNQMFEEWLASELNYLIHNSGQESHATQSEYAVNQSPSI